MLQVIFIPEGVYNFLTSPSIAKIYLIIRIFFSIFSIILVLAIILLIYRIYLAEKIRASMKLGEGKATEPRINRLSGRWAKVKERLDTNDENNYKLAILEADAIFDGVIEGYGYKGKDFEDRIKQVSSSNVGNVDDIMEAHKLRNDIVDNPKMSVSYFQAKKAFDVFERALRMLDAI